MKTNVLVLILLLGISQAYAWGEREQSALLGLVSGVIVANVYHNGSTLRQDNGVNVVHCQPGVRVMRHKPDHVRSKRNLVRFAPPRERKQYRRLYGTYGNHHIGRRDYHYSRVHR
jgi:hypothetical protein